MLTATYFLDVSGYKFGMAHTITVRTKIVCVLTDSGSSQYLNPSNL